jgi:hypothetical protein
VVDGDADQIEFEAAGEGLRATTDDLDGWSATMREVMRNDGLRARPQR